MKPSNPPNSETASETPTIKLTLEQEVNSVLLDYAKAKGIDLGTATKDLYPLFTKPVLAALNQHKLQWLESILPKKPDYYNNHDFQRKYLNDFNTGLVYVIDQIRTNAQSTNRSKE